MAKVAMDDASKRTPRAIHDHCGWSMRRGTSSGRSAFRGRAPRTAATVAVDTPPRRRCALPRRSVASAVTSRSDSGRSEAGGAAASPWTVLRPSGLGYPVPRGQRRREHSHIRVTEPPGRESLDCRCAPDGADVGRGHEEVAYALSRDVPRGVVDERVEELTVVGHLRTIGLLHRGHLSLDSRRAWAWPRPAYRRTVAPARRAP